MVTNTAGVEFGSVNIQDVIDDESCFRKVRELRWPEGWRCPFCSSEHIIKHGCDQTQAHRQKYGCNSYDRYFTT